MDEPCNMIVSQIYMKSSPDGKNRALNPVEETSNGPNKKKGGLEQFRGLHL